MESEKIEVTQSQASWDELQRFMEGDNAAQGGRFDAEPRGLFSEPTVWQPEEQRERLSEPDQVPGQSQAPDDASHWKQLYGRSENEKGQWRRTAEEALAELQKVRQEIELLRSLGPAPQPTQPASTPQPYGAYVGVTPQPTTPIPATGTERFIQGKEDDDLVQVKDLERVLRDLVAPAVATTWQQTQLLTQQALQAQRRALGITPAVEARLIQAHPWLQYLPEGPAKIDAMAELVQRAREAASASAGNGQAAGNAPSGPRPQPTSQQAQQVVRRVTYVESAAPSSSAPAGEQSLDDMIRADMAEAMKKPYGVERRKAMEEVFRKYGIGHINDFGPNVLTR